MPVMTIALTLIEAKREKEQLTGEIQVNSVPRIKSVKEFDLPHMNKKALEIEFDFETDYSDAGKIRLGGKLLFTDDRHDEILKSWKENSVLDRDAAVEVFNALFAKCLLKSSMLAEDLQLPLPLTLPRVKPNEGTTSPKEASKEATKDDSEKKDK